MVCPEILGIYRTQTFQTMYGCAWTFKPKGYFLSYLRIPEPQLQPKHLSWGFGEEKKGSRPVSPILYTISAPRIKKKHQRKFGLWSGWTKNNGGIIL